jgi:hypothetical protein
MLSGCERTEILGKVSGQVTLDGAPISQGVVVFSNSAKGVHIAAPLREDGSYELQMAKGFGLPLGDYRVAVNPPVPSAPIPGTPQPPSSRPPAAIPPRYWEFETSGLATSVQKGDNVFNISLLSN